VIDPISVSFYTCSRWVKTHFWGTKGNGGWGALEQDYIFIYLYIYLYLYFIYLFIYLIFWDNFGIIFHSFHIMFWNTPKMNYWCEAFNKIIITFQKKYFFNNLLIFQTFSFVWMKKLYPMFFLKAHEWNFHMELKWYNQVVFNIWIIISWSSWVIVWIWNIFVFCNILLWVHTQFWKIMFVTVLFIVQTVFSPMCDLWMIHALCVRL
jgi:hypothetical protein